jgi:oligoribonuclease
MRTLFWVDLEMTGLDEVTDKILEVAVVVTDMDFKTLEEYHRIVFQPPQVLENMNDWCKKTHGESGLTAAVPGGTPLETVEKELIALVSRHYASNERVVLAGNSVGNDQRFLLRYMPELAKRLHYRVIDVTSFKEVFKNKWNLSFPKGNSHRAVDDIHESIHELKYFLSFIQVPQAGAQPAPAGSTTGALKDGKGTS